jgi:hypothetical protein
MKSRALLSLCVVTLFGQYAWAARIACSPGGNEVIQSCIDQAAPGDTIVFSGAYQIDPAKPFVEILDKSKLAFVGAADDPPLFTCQLDPDGRPTVLTNFRLNAVFNDHPLSVGQKPQLRTQERSSSYRAVPR